MTRRPATVHLGYELGTGQPVEIPVQHLAVTGQTQQSGKTTTLEALVGRSGLKAIAFVTKRHEASFTTGKPLRPYFRERADWQFVSAVLEATLRERLKFERSWIMRACKGARTLRSVQENVQLALEKAKGMSADVYLTLDHYLDIVVPQIEQLPYTDKLAPAAGLNVMDLSDYTAELQALVIRSVLEWVYEQATDTLVIIPEAWEFIPQNRGSPVLLAAEQLIRKGGAARNFVWLDSQDIAGVHKNILRQVGVWILGVQREANEVKRALAHIPGNVRKPGVDDVMQLERGQFFACFGKTVVKVYVQPAWMLDADAAAIARGRMTIDDAGGPPARKHLKQEGNKVDENEARALRAENEELKNRVKGLEAIIERMQAERAPAPAAASAPTTTFAPENMDMDAIYAEVKRRAQSDPTLLKILASKAELEVVVERRKIEVDGFSLRGRVGRLLAQGFFDEGATNSGTRAELKRTGPDANNANLARVLSELQRDGFLTLEAGDRFRAVPDMKVNVVERAAA